VPYADPEAQRRYQREWAASRRREYVDGQVCAKCGSDERLELHHLDKTTKVSHRIWTWSRDRIEAELAKCEWWCRNCHEKHHAAEQRYDWDVCGTRVGYNKRGCRCERCKRWRRDDGRAYRARQLDAVAA